MKTKRTKRTEAERKTVKLFAAGMAATMALGSTLGLCGCGGNKKPVGGYTEKPVSGLTKNLTAELTAKEVERGSGQAFTESNLGFATEFFKRSFEEADGENMLTSPLSAAAVLGMIACGAKGDTLSEMENTLGSSLGAFNGDISAYMAYLNGINGEKSRLSLADSIWVRNSMTDSIRSGFLQTNKDYYDADIFASPFTVETCKDVNAWISNKTEGMIDKVLDEEEAPSEDSFMYLVNALYFEGKWERDYPDSAVYNGDFTSFGGETLTSKMMSSEEGIYLHDDTATGFIKPYADNRLAFAAILPNENLSIDEYVATMSRMKWKNLFETQTEADVKCRMPAFEYEFEIKANDILSAMGMPSAFVEGKADFSGMISSPYSAYISRIFQKTKIEVSEKGTKAAAVTVGDMATEAMPSDLKYVILNRPFVYAIIDTVNNYPLFIGALLEPTSLK